MEYLTLILIKILCRCTFPDTIVILICKFYALAPYRNCTSLIIVVLADILLCNRVHLRFR